MDSTLLFWQMLFSLAIASAIVGSTKVLLGKMRWDLRQVNEQALQGQPLARRRLISLLSFFLPLVSPLARPSLSVRRGLAVLGFHPAFDDLLFSRLCWAACAATGLILAALAGLAGMLGMEGFLRWLLVLVLIATPLAAVLPRIWLHDQAFAAKRAVLRSFPTFLDVLALVLESGQNFQSALQLSVQRLSNTRHEAVLKRQLQELTQDIRAGQSKVMALQRFSDRIGLPEVTQFAASIKAADQQGVSVTALLRRQAEQLRMSRALAAERQAMKLPVKLLLPLAVCIFPCTFLILAFPLAMRLSNSGLF